MHERLEAISHGRVQMVMYRDFVQRKARSLSLTGKVQNQTDGTVRIIAEGSRTDLDKLILQLKNGPLFAHVEDVHVSFMSATGSFTDFSISYD